VADCVTDPMEPVEVDRCPVPGPCWVDSPVPGSAHTSPAAAEGEDLAALIRAAGAGATLCWDTETSSLVGHVIQIAVVAVPRGAAAADGTLPDCVRYCRHWALPDGVALDPRAVAVHGITRSHLAARGCPVLPGLRALAAVVHAGREGGAQWVAHNASFDVARLNHTAAFHGAPVLLERGEVLCTMRLSTAHCGAKSRSGRAKAPRCDELYAHLFQRPFEGVLHDALADATLLASCVLGGRHRGWWA
jgi:DNA polymerase III epsilon subunit-like protein